MKLAFYLLAFRGKENEFDFTYIHNYFSFISFSSNIYFKYFNTPFSYSTKLNAYIRYLDVLVNAKICDNVFILLWGVNLSLLIVYLNKFV